jgi:hypothetical protein
MGITLDQWRKSIGCNVTPNLLCLGSFLTSHNPTFAYVILLLLLTAGNIHPNPGPTQGSTRTNFQNEHERSLFNKIRNVDNRIASHRSHIDFYSRCLSERVIPKGLNLKIAMSAVIPGAQNNMNEFLNASKENLLTVLKQSYESQLQALEQERIGLLSNLEEHCSEVRFRKLNQDLTSIAKNIASRLKNKKNKKINVILHEKQAQAKTQKQKNSLGRWLPDLGLYEKNLTEIKENKWIDDVIMNAASQFLKTEFPLVSGLYSTSFSRLGFIHNPYQGIQFHNVNGTHWVLSSSLHGKIQVYDSLKGTGGISDDLRRQLTEIYSPDGRSVTVEIVDVQQQYGGNDCGLFSIAFSIDLLLGNDVNHIQYDQSTFRSHLLNCFEEKRITPFPRKRMDMNRRRSSIVEGEWKQPKTTSNKRQVEPRAPITISNSFESLNLNEFEADEIESESEVTTEKREGTPAKSKVMPAKSKVPPAKSKGTPEKSKGTPEKKRKKW